MLPQRMPGSETLRNGRAPTRMSLEVREEQTATGVLLSQVSPGIIRENKPMHENVPIDKLLMKVYTDQLITI